MLSKEAVRIDHSCHVYIQCNDIKVIVCFVMMCVTARGEESADFARGAAPQQAFTDDLF